MPEGDTVYQSARRLDTALAGKVLTETDFRVPAFATVDLAGRTVDEVVSRGKHLLARVGDMTIHSHLKMEGSWELYRPGAHWRHPAHQARVILRTEDTTAVGFQLGLLEVISRDREEEAVGYLGPDLLGADWDAGEAVRRLAEHPDAPIAVALLDQRNLAGLGNEYVNELCFLRGMLPTRPVRDADLAAAVRLGHRMIVANRDRTVRVTTGDTRRGRTSWVYGREGELCLRCGTRIQRSELGRNELELRVSYYCPHCQT
ncbi:DNA-formamidopyrimidine glycosylase family protein [Leifsonia poae]|uniref:DNA-(apurinic or apyrimidinic site) lyase n=1 Tax=Leifsonia poae TaxID=110933 RepID=A0A9W6H8C8_9MICO|nr:DNA-formamidopyrimidine glycosylase family protein [Leifsonia poae]GLJ75222.1 putative DNA glycosylase Nei [Leifsonia poae]